jgi:anti-sigma regulatory factor (Ser/Thr protein kinase)
MLQEIFPAEIDQLPKMLQSIETFGLKIGFSKEILTKIIVAAEEALVNIVYYGYPEQKGEIFLTCKATQDKPGMVIVIEDHGIPFDPTQKITPEIPPINEIGGLGIYIFIGVMDRVEYERHGKGNILTMTKYF